VALAQRPFLYHSQLDGPFNNDFISEYGKELLSTPVPVIAALSGNNCPKRPCHTKAKYRTPLVQVRVVAGFGVVLLQNDRSVYYPLGWEETEINKAEIEDETLRGRFVQHYKTKYRGDEWKRWVGDDFLRGRRYGCNLWG
jgi:hypothetical protein